MIQTLKSEVRNGVRIVRGIRYATANRFQDSQLNDRVDQYEGTHAPTAPQLPGTVEKLLNIPAQPMSEDCLFLNIFAPEGANVGDDLPVMVWIHGGAYLNGSGGTPWYDGSNLARRGCVVVTVNYRLGAFGFLGANNWGIGDQINALRWVNQHIAHVGGDSRNVTIFGESAGGSSVLALVAAPATNGLVQRAIAMSPSIGQYRTDGVATSRESEFHTYLAIDANNASIEEILAAQSNVVSAPGQGFDAFSPTLGGTHIPADIIKSVAESDVQLMIGTTKDENRLFTTFDPSISQLDAAGVIARISSTFGDRAEMVYKAYASHNIHHTPPQVLAAIETDGTFRLPARRLADARSKNGLDTHVYWFAVDTTSFGGVLGSCHAADIPFTFNNLDMPGVTSFIGDIPDAVGVAEWFSQKLVAFASGIEPWEPYRQDNQAVISVEADPRILVAHESELLHLWE